MRFGFVTCVQLGLSCMEAIYEAGGSLALAVTLEDDQAQSKSGRVRLDDFCARHAIPLAKFRNINEDAAVEAIQEARLDWLFIVGWSQIALERVLLAPRLGVLGMHPTLLPQGRGRAPIPWAILKRLDRTGVTLFKLDGGIDTGDIVDQIEIPLAPDTNATDLYRRVEEAHVNLTRKALPALVSGRVRLRTQSPTEATEWPARRPEDGEIDLNGSAEDAECLVRAVTRPYPGAYFFREGRKVIVWKARRSTARSGLSLVFRDGILECLEWEEADVASGPG